MNKYLKLASLAMLGLMACSDPCKDKLCQNGGECSDGDCICTTWYEGESCEMEFRRQYYGIYTGFMTTPDGSSVQTIVQVSSSEQGPDYVLINGDAFAQLKNRNGEFDIPSQASGSEQVSGSGGFQDKRLEFNFVSSSLGGTTNQFSFSGEKP